MRSLVAVLPIVVAVTAATAPSAFAAKVGLSQGGFMEGDGYIAVVSAEPGETNDVQVSVSPNAVTFTDSAGIAPEPVEGDEPCLVVSATEARCTAPGDAQITLIGAGLGDGDDQIRFTPTSTPVPQSISGGDGDDRISTGVSDRFQRSFRRSIDGGAGNDEIHLAPRVSLNVGLTDGWHVVAGEGDDTIYALNLAQDDIGCGSGADTLVADPFDIGYHYPAETTECEERPVPEVPLPTLPL